MRARSAESKRVHHSNETSLGIYDETARAAAAAVLDRYSTSFGAGARLLPRAMRSHIEAVYAMVRIGDEIVDTYRGSDARAVLDAFEVEVDAAIARGFSANVIAHAFSMTAREVGIGPEQTVPFFASMRMDLDITEHTPDSFARYVHGSAEVVGEMCLAVFVNTGTDPAPLDEGTREGARRLGAAYQKVNFLRDLAMDSGQLGRSYFPGISADALTDAQLVGLVADARADIEAARTCLPALSRRPAIAVRTTIDVYERLLRQLDSMSARDVMTTRIRVPDAFKLLYAIRNACAPTRWLTR